MRINTKINWARVAGMSALGFTIFLLIAWLIGPPLSCGTPF
jgi:hypothetical protein